MDGYVDFQKIAKTAEEINKEDNYRFDEKEIKDFRLFTRKEIQPALGVDITSLPKKIADIEHFLSEETGKEVKFGVRDHCWMYSVEEVYTMCDALRKMPSRSKPVQKFRKPTNSSAFVIVIANQKGGAGKTTVTVNLASSLSLKDFSQARILVIDIDPQGSIYNYLDGRYRSMYNTPTLSKYLMNEYVHMYDSSNDTEIKDFIKNNLIHKSMLPNLDFCLAFSDDCVLDNYLSGLSFYQSEHEDLDEQFLGTSSMTVLQNRFIDKVKDDYDIILIDCPPTINQTVANACFSADHLLIPSPTKQMDKDSTNGFLIRLNEYTQHFNDLGKIGFRGITGLPVMYDMKSTADSVLAKYNTLFGVYNYPYPIRLWSGYNELGLGYDTIHSKRGENSIHGLADTKKEWEGLASHIMNAARKNWSY